MIEVRNLRVVFPNGHEALQDVSFEVPEGQIVCIIDRSGAGKSTLLRCLNGLIEATAGRIAIQETDVTGASRASGTPRPRARVSRGPPTWPAPGSPR